MMDSSRADLRIQNAVFEPPSERRGGLLAAVVVTILPLLAALAPAQQSERSPANEKTVLAIFAHPDDEGMVTPVLAKYAREGAAVYLAVVTSGQEGKRPGIEIPRGEQLGLAREAEAACAAERLGIHLPILLRYWDGKVVENLNKLRDDVRGLFERLRPQVVITWGAEGLYGHADHRLVGAVVTEVFQSRRPGENWPQALYYPELPARRLSQYTPPSPGFNAVDEAFLSFRIPYSEQDFERARRSFTCHDTQFSPEDMAKMMHFKKEAEGGTAYLRPCVADPVIKNDLFE